MADGDQAGGPVSEGIETLRRLLGEASSLLQSCKPRTYEAAAFTFRLPEDFAGEHRSLRVSFGTKFPVGGLSFEVSPSAWLAWPHAMSKSLCLYGVGQRAPNASPEVVVGDALERLRDVLRLVVAGSDEEARRSEFESEITTYWDAQLPGCGHQVVMNSVPLESCQLFGLYTPRDRSGDGRVRLSASVQGLAQLVPGSPSAARTRELRRGVRAPAPVGFFLKLSSLPPVAMPGSDQLIPWASQHASQSDQDALAKWLHNSARFPTRYLVMQLPSDDGAGLVVWALASTRDRSAPRVGYGRRASRRQAFKPDSVRGSVRVWRAAIHVLDARFAHARDPNSNAAALADRHVLMVGAGSLGSALAAKLLRSGLGRLTLIDEDALEDVNLGRHELGAADVGRKKVEALAERFGRDFPMSAIASIGTTFEAALLSRHTLLDTIDAVVTTTGNWFPESLLWGLKARGARWSVVQAWSEPHAAVGHVLTVGEGAHDARPLFDGYGNFVEPWSHWPNEGIVPLPACGAGFIPGGPLGIGDIATLACRVTIETLTQPSAPPAWHVLAREVETIEKAGGTYLGRALGDGMTQGSWRLPWPEGKAP